MSARNLEAGEHGWRVRDPRDLGADGGGGSAPDDSDIPLLEAIIRATDSEKHQSEENNGADDEKNLKLSQRLKSKGRAIGQPAQNTFEPILDIHENDALKLTPGELEQEAGAG